MHRNPNISEKACANSNITNLWRRYRCTRPLLLLPLLSPFPEFCGVKNKDRLCICRRKGSDPGIICYCFYCWELKEEIWQKGKENGLLESSLLSWMPGFRIIHSLCSPKGKHSLQADRKLCQLAKYSLERKEPGTFKTLTGERKTSAHGQSEASICVPSWFSESALVSTMCEARAEQVLFPEQL